ncbi:MAG: hypothetical protein HY744_28570 [Deltaproteobacteria bacterium]|nr:hypothetical protein [Deltaproteobacteria bacterium]
MTHIPPTRRCLWLALCTLLGGCRCSGSEPPAPTAAPGSAPSPAASATVSAQGTANPEAAPSAVCTAEKKKLWGKGTDTRTGITATELADGSIALGVSFDTRPHTLVFDREGAGTLRRVPVDSGQPLAKPIAPADGVRHLQRVTVTAGLRTYSDYRDKYQNGRRRVACGPTSGDPLLVFDGEPLLEDAEDRPQTAKGASGTAPGTSSASATASAPAPASGVGSAEAAAAGGEPRRPLLLRLARGDAGAPGPADEGPLRELRDCRSFVDLGPAGSDAWAVGSELVGERQSEGQVKWTMRLFVAADSGRRRTDLHTVALPREPERLHTLEAPVAHRLADGSYALAGRYKGQMYAWILSADMRKRTSLQVYGGGYPSLPRILPDGPDHLLLTSQRVDLSHWKLRAIRFGPDNAKLLATLATPPISEGEESMAEPTLARVGEQRWLAYQGGDRRRAALLLVPVDRELAAAGRSYQVSAEGEEVFESHVFALGDGRLLVAYIARAANGPAGLVSEVLRCRVIPS